MWEEQIRNCHGRAALRYTSIWFRRRLSPSRTIHQSQNLAINTTPTIKALKRGYTHHFDGVIVSFQLGSVSPARCRNWIFYRFSRSLSARKAKNFPRFILGQRSFSSKVIAPTQTQPTNWCNWTINAAVWSNRILKYKLLLVKVCNSWFA